MDHVAQYTEHDGCSSADTRKSIGDAFFAARAADQLQTRHDSLVAPLRYSGRRAFRQAKLRVSLLVTSVPARASCRMNPSIGSKSPSHGALRSTDVYPHSQPPSASGYETG